MLDAWQGLYPGFLPGLAKPLPFPFCPVWPFSGRAGIFRVPSQHDQPRRVRGAVTPARAGVN